MMSFINAAVPDLDGSLDWAENQREEIDQELIKQFCYRVGTDTAAMDAFAKELHSAITHLVEGEPLRIVMGSTNGLETWRLFSKRYHPRSSGTKRQTLTKLLNLKTCKTFTELDAGILWMAELIREYDSMSSKPLDDDITAATLVNICPHEVKENIDLGNTKDSTYAELKDSIASWISRKKEMDPKALSKMETSLNGKGDPIDVDIVEMNKQLQQQVANLENYLYGRDQTWMNGQGYTQAPTKCYDEDPHMSSEVHAVGKEKPKGKGHVPGCFSCKGSIKGQKGRGQRKRQGEGPKRTCKRISGRMWRIWSFTTLLSKVEPTNTHNIEVEQQPSTTLINALEERDGKDWRHVIGSVELAEKPIKLRNRFTVLSEHDDEIQDLESTTAGDLSDGVHDQHLTEEDYPLLKTNKKNRKWHAMPRNRTPFRKMEVNSLETEVNSVGNVDSKKLVVTVDSGAAESVMNETHAPPVPTRTSKGGITRVEYVNANGTSMPNRGEKILPSHPQQRRGVQPEDADHGRASSFTLRFARLWLRAHCDVKGWRNDQTHRVGEGVLHFGRVNGVYRMMEVELANPSSSFSRPA